ncbi:MAG: AAA family ATPase [Magnetococcales bacterium]|nr:AAA family ATPase [Magnetococcales bacterium]
MSEYQGMRWFKCDLHMHTPEESRNWRDEETKLGEPRRAKIEGQLSEVDIQEKARKYLHRCHDAGLHVIGITDHNFSAKSNSRDWFLVHLVEQNGAVAKERNVDRLHILPGFEVDIGYHLLCLFNPVTGQGDLESINRILIKLGMSESERFASGNPQPLRRNHTTVSLKELIEIVQGSYGGMVIAAHTDQKSGLLSSSDNKEDYANPDLYCVELTQNPPAARYNDILSGKLGDWKRKDFHPAWILSSDAKSLASGENAQPVANSLGCRYSWIKMSKPSIESLRQAFLDPQSRIRLSGDEPSKQEKHARILSVSVANAAFLGDQNIVFSPNLNCIIGGRGSGKSAILEGMRLAMGKDDDPKLGKDEETSKKVARIKKLLTKEEKTKVRVCWRNVDGVDDTLVYSVDWQGDGICQVDGREMPDLSSFLKDLPAQFFSQQQLNHVTTQDGNILLALLDEFAREELKPLRQQETQLRQEIEQIFASTTILEQTENDLKRIQQEATELERQWTARAALQEEARRHQGLKAEETYIQRLKSSLKEDADRLTAVVDDMCETHALLGTTTDRWPHGTWFKAKDEQVQQAKESFRQAIRESVETYRKTTVPALFSNDPEWKEIQQQISQADAAFSHACAEKGISPADVSRMQEIDRQRTAKKLELQQKEKELTRLQQIAQRLPDLLQGLHTNWRASHTLRTGVAKGITQSARIDGKPVIELSVSYCAEKTTFDAVWKRLSTDGRTKLGKNWEEIGTIVREAYDTQHFASPWAMLQSWLDDENRASTQAIERLAALKVSLAEIKTHLFGPSRKTWQETRLTRIEDEVDLVLYRADGSEAVGRVSDGTLSDGQRNTAALAMLLARGNHPLVIDQPEDELDSNFIFRELVPMLRRLKHSRQIILATHNANLPVNGDAELVYAMKAVNGHGIKLAEGGLDQARVTGAVLDIMEGSEQAFRQRKEKYHF